LSPNARAFPASLQSTPLIAEIPMFCPPFCLSIAKGEIPAPVMRFNGHRYVPAIRAEQAERERDEAVKALEPGSGFIRGLDLLSGEEKRAMLKKAEYLWRRLQANDLGGYSGVNRPFYILNAFMEIIEDYGRRDIGEKHTGYEIEAHQRAAAIVKRGEDKT